ncbi:hypothetical protein D4764_01G0004230 [Takifugu flavidus]|uniref:Uncharacterized protein n=1 Tax=Takifugu flavidus TaxID=433684 RepID=A0A5C6PPD3_9TELE|nr:hypothetical protein D4764_01G0004230 [Takifugu flavidus]
MAYDRGRGGAIFQQLALVTTPSSLHEESCRISDLCRASFLLAAFKTSFS